MLLVVDDEELPRSVTALLGMSAYQARPVADHAAGCLTGTLAATMAPARSTMSLADPVSSRVDNRARSTSESGCSLVATSTTSGRAGAGSAGGFDSGGRSGHQSCGSFQTSRFEGSLAANARSACRARQPSRVFGSDP